MAGSKILLIFLLLFLISTSSFRSTTAQTDAGELQTLLAIKAEWGNPSALSSWSSNNASYCSWAGVSCNNNRHVAALSFPKFTLPNPIPAAICNLKNLSYLDLSYINLTGPFPTQLYSCSSLQFLDLSNNLLSSALPDDINKLSLGMEHLNLSNNGFTGSVPRAIASFPNLKSLVLDTNKFDRTYPGSAIGGLTKLETLTLADNPFTSGPIPHEFGKLTKLQMLWLSGMNLTGGIPDTLSSLTELTTLALSNNTLDGEIPSWVWKLQKLEFLYLFGNRFAGAIGPEISAVNMVELDLSANMLTGSIPESIGNLKKMRLLYLYYNNINGTIPASIGLLPNLTDIRLFNNRLSGPLPPELGKHSLLDNLEVSDNFLVGEVPDTLCFNKKLRDIVLFNNSFSGEFPAVLGDCDTLDSIMLQNNYFSGEFPAKVWSSFPKLTTVQIQNNSFTGTLPRVINPNITRIEMGNNKFSGDVPASAVGLATFMAENNKFSGALPADMSGFAEIMELNLAGNKISGSIPSSIGSLAKLNSLNISNNQLSSSIPPTIGMLPVLTILDLSNNGLAGGIPQEFNNLHLVSLNLSYNQLNGEVPDSLQNGAYDRAFLGNRGLCGTLRLHANLPACGYKGHNQIRTLIILLSALVGVALLGAAGWFLIRRQRQQRDVTAWKMTPFRKLEFTERDVLTRLHEEEVIGQGGSGKVYRVRLRNGTVVAAKKLLSPEQPEKKLQKENEFENEVRTLGDIRHASIVNLLCCISSADTKLLVYEYMENGSLARWLHPRDDPVAGDAAPLDWPTRLRVAVDAARGLCYLHQECVPPVLHQDVKSDNILLDPAFRAKIADFGLACNLVKFGEPEVVSTYGGTFGYISPECAFRRMVNQMSDVYSFGVVLLELTTGRVANDLSDSENGWLRDWAWRRFKAAAPLDDVVDGRIPNRAAFVKDAVDVFLLGISCTEGKVELRPTMQQVLQQLLWYDRTSSGQAGACGNVGQG